AAIEQYSRLVHEWDSELMLRHRLAVLMAIQDGADLDAMHDAIGPIGNFWEGVGFLVRDGHVQLRLVSRAFCVPVRMWWAALAPTVALWDTEENESGVWSDFKWWAELMDENDRKAGKQRDFGEDFLRTSLPSAIATNTKALRTAEALRAT